MAETDRPMSAPVQTVPPPSPISLHSGLLRATLTLTAAGIVVKLAATAKEIAVAGIYGRSDAMDALLAAALLPGLLVNLISESMNLALVPTFIRVREQQGREAAQRLLSNSLVCMCLLLAGVSLAAGLGARAFFPLIASHFAPAKMALAIRLFYGLLPVVLLTGIATHGTGILNALGRFTAPALTPLVISISVIAGTLVLGGRAGIWALVVATAIGSFLQAALAVTMMQAGGFQFRLRWYGMDKATREVAIQYGPVLLSGLVASSGLLVDQSMAAMLAAGSVSALVYANRFVSVVLTLSAGAISTSIMPHFSHLIALRDWPSCRRTLRTWTLLTALVSIPIAAALVLGAHGLVRIAFQRGAFGPGDTEIVARVLAMYALQIPFFVVSRVFYRFVVAMRRTDLVLHCGLINLALDVVLNLVLMRWLGVAGIALATSLWTVSTFLFLGYWAWRLLADAEVAAAPPASCGTPAARPQL